MQILGQNPFSKLSNEIMLLIIERLVLTNPFILFDLMQIDRRFWNLTHDARLIKKVIHAWFPSRGVPITAATLKELSDILRMVMLGMNSDLILKAKKAALISRQFNPDSILPYGQTFTIQDLMQLPNLLNQLPLRDANCLDAALAAIAGQKKFPEKVKKFILSLLDIVLCRAFSFPGDQELPRLSQALEIVLKLFRKRKVRPNLIVKSCSKGCDFFNFETIWVLLLTSELNVSLQVLASLIIKLFFEKRAHDPTTMDRLIKFMMQAQSGQFYDPVTLMEVAVDHVGVRNIKDLSTLFSEGELIAYLRGCFIRSCIKENSVFFAHIIHFFKDKPDILQDYARALIDGVHTHHVAMVLDFFLRDDRFKLTLFVLLILQEALSVGEGKLAFILSYVVDGRRPKTLSYIISDYLIDFALVRECVGRSPPSKLIISFRNKPMLWHTLLRDLRDNPSGNWACTRMFLQEAERKKVDVFGQHYLDGLTRVSLLEIIKKNGVRRWGASEDEQSAILELIKNYQPGNNPRTAPVSLLWRAPSESASQAPPPALASPAY